jgi:alpha-mannosidase
VFEQPGFFPVTVEDDGGSWGTPGCDNCSQVLHAWKVTAIETAETGPERSRLRVRMAAGASRIDFDFMLWRGRRAMDVSARLFWAERAARLKLIMPLEGGVERATFDVPGGTIERGPLGEVPGGKWVRAIGPGGELGFASDTIHGFDITDGALRASVVRGSRYAADSPTSALENAWRPATDQGEHRFRFIITPGGGEIADLAEELERAPVTILTAPHPGLLAREGSLVSLAPGTVRMLALKRSEEGRGFIV